jgi:hypothetical protein
MKVVLSILLVVATATSIHANRCLRESNGVTLPSVDYCESYALCFNGLEINLECPENHWYDFLQNICLPESEAMCYKLHSTQQCPKDGLSAIPHPESCSKYFICFDGESIERECFDGLHWNNEEQQCMQPELAGCQQINDDAYKCPATNTPGEIVFIPSAESCSK